ncbi:MAG: invasion protein IalB [Paracoccaceae bacterium]|jgi:invasion protein IalB
MYTLIRTLSFTALLALCGPAFAQSSGTTTTASPVGELAMGEEVVDPLAPGTIYAREVSGDWEIRCIRVPEGQIEPCNLYQLLKDGEGNNVAEITLFALPPGQKAAAGAQVITPLETLLTQQITLSVDGGVEKKYPFAFCNRIGCYSQLGFTNDDVLAFRRGVKGMIKIVPVGAPADTTVDLEISLAGFTAGFNIVRQNALDVAESQN